MVVWDLVIPVKTMALNIILYILPSNFLKTLDRTHLQGRKSDKASKYDGYHLLFTFLFISGPLLEIKAVLLYPSLLVILTLATKIY